MLKRLLVLLVICIVSFSYYGCEENALGRVKLDQIALIRLAAFDKKEDDQVCVTLVSKAVKSDGNKEAPQKQAIILTEDGRTIFEANRKFNAFSNKDIFWGHVEFLLIGEDAARDDIVKYLDYVVRDHSLRLTPIILITKGTTAEEAIIKMNVDDAFISDNINSIVENARGSLSYSSKISLVEIINALDSEFESAYIPCITLVQKTIRKEETDKYDPKLDGYGIFKKNQLIGYVQGENARGLNWIVNKVSSGYMIVKDLNHKDVCLEIIEAQSKIKPKIEGDELSVEIAVQMSSNISEYEGTNNIFNEEGLYNLNKQQEEKIRKEMEYIIRYTQKNGVDVLGIGDAVYHKYPIQWEKYKKNWQDEAFKEISINISIKSKINRSYLFQQPIGNKEKERE